MFTWKCVRSANIYDSHVCFSFFPNVAKTFKFVCMSYYKFQRLLSNISTRKYFDSSKIMAARRPSLKSWIASYLTLYQSDYFASSESTGQIFSKLWGDPLLNNQMSPSQNGFLPSTNMVSADHLWFVPVITSLQELFFNRNEVYRCPLKSQQVWFNGGHL